MFSIKIARKLLGDDSKVVEAMENGSISYHAGLQNGTDKYNERFGKTYGNNQASGQLGEIYRAEFENWMNQFLPVDRKLMEMANSSQDNIMSESDAISVTRTGFDNARKSDELSRRGLGVNLQADEKAYLDKKSGLAEAAALATNVNNTRLHAADRDRQIMSGGLTGGLRDLTNMTGGN